MMISMLMLARRFRHLFVQAASRPGMTDSVGFSFPLSAILYQVTTNKNKKSSLCRKGQTKGGQQHQLSN
jgi:hypothetical protein